MSFKEMLLIPKAEFKRLNLAEHEAESKKLTKIRRNRNLTKHERKTKFVQNLDTYLKHAADYREPVKISLEKVEEKKKIDDDEMPTDFPTLQIEELFPRKLRKRARTIYDKIRILPNVVEKSAKSVRIDRKNLKHGLLYYVREMLTPDDGSVEPMRGYEKFVSLLNDAKIHLNSVPNTRYKFKLRQYKRNIISEDSDSESQVGGGCLFKYWKNFRF
jgi:hypothetical protein